MTVERMTIVLWRGGYLPGKTQNTSVKVPPRSMAKLKEDDEAMALWEGVRVSLGQGECVAWRGRCACLTLALLKALEKVSSPKLPPPRRTTPY